MQKKWNEETIKILKKDCKNEEPGSSISTGECLKLKNGKIILILDPLSINSSDNSFSDNVFLIDSGNLKQFRVNWVGPPPSDIGIIRAIKGKLKALD